MGNDTGFYVAIITALLTAITGILAPCVSAIIAQRGARKAKFAELFYLSKVDAYKDVILFSAKFPERPTDADLMNLYGAIATAMLFSTNKTKELLANYSSLLMNSTNLDDLDPSEPDFLQSLAEAQRKAILAMQREIEKCR